MGLDPSIGSEASKRRPAVIVSNDGANHAAFSLERGVVTVVPLTTNTEHVYPFQVLIPAETSLLDRDCKAQSEQVRSLDVRRVGEAIGILPLSLMASLDSALRLHLAL